MESCLNKSESNEIHKPTFNLNDHNEVLLDKVRHTTFTTSPDQVDCMGHTLVDSSTQNSTVLFILVIIVDDFPHESIWRLWIEHWELQQQQQQQQQLHLCSIIDTSADDVDTPSLKNTIVDEIVCNSAKNMSSVVDSLYDNTITSQPGDEVNIHQLPCQNVPLSAPVRFLFHAKHPEKVTRPWVKDRMVKTFQKKPTWGSLELTEVMLCMLEEVRSL